MRRILRTKTIGTKVSLVLLTIAITSCNSLKRVGENELLVKRNTIFTDSIKVNDEDIESLILQNPNSTILGYPLRLNLYNLAKKNPDSSFQAWLYRKEKREERLIKLLSRKQVVRLGESFLVKGLSETLKKIGEAPVILDTTETKRTLERLSAYYRGQGYLNNNTSYTIDSLAKRQRAEVIYQITLGKPFIIDSVGHNIASPAIDSLYQLNKAEAFIQKGDQFNIGDFSKERERLAAVFGNNGVYNFQESSIKFDILSDTTKIANDQQMGVILNIDDLRKRGEGLVTTEPYKVSRFENINIYTDFLFDERDSELQFIRYEGYTIFYRNKLRFKPKTLADAIFFEKDSVYSDIDKVRTYRQISNLGVFKYPTINFETDSTGTRLSSNIYLAARPKYSFGANLDVTHSNIQQIGMALSPSLQARNLFKGAENLSLSARLSIGNSSDPNIQDNRFFNIQEYGADLSLDFPRIWFPFFKTSRLIPSYTLPRTRISLGTSFQQNIGLDKQTFNSILGYSWTPSEKINHGVELLNVQFVNNVRPEQFFRFYRSSYADLDGIADNYQDDATLVDLFVIPEGSDEPQLSIPDGTDGFIEAVETNAVSGITNEDRVDVLRIEERRERLTEDNLIFASNYTLNLNNRTDITDNNFFRFRFKFESAGNLLSGLSNLIPFDEEDDKLEVLDVPFSQYLKGETEFVKYWDLRRSNVLAFRSFFGIAVPYGNSNSIPFVRSYFAGGANDNRGWFPYSLGPGRTDAINDFNEANLKIALNLEYRFPIAGNFKGALFADAGNIWNVFDNVEDPDAKFVGISSLADIALGSGFGLRYDFTYFLFRVDLGFKTYNPAEEISKRWFRDYNFANSVLQIGINYPF
ncbi:BamA/TamA family outer membrane protein [Flavobacteriaceae bacterium TP-CH-4]|uniref:BamA/TamA family outer membrane protein n=1 Tax=Pelagihabitans pacificus TaxID=2696054 RepID=A0A967AWW4_9FLAO|nr:BamA/TamA family outer membrane protein [Pelagihabitans pacificus]NHF60845.1 BamA/TamA family outer membrane protein [Pelagihabitans pacificus]